MQIARFTFTNDDLDLDYKVSFNHDKDNIGNILLYWLDENGIDRTSSNIFQIMGEFDFDLYCGDSITGTHEVYMLYDDTEQIRGRHLFNLDLVTSLPADYRLPIGIAGDSRNIELNTLTDAITTKTTATKYLMKDAKVLSEIKALGDSAVSTARNNIAIWNKSKIDFEINLERLRLQSGDITNNSINDISLLFNIRTHNVTFNFSPDVTGGIIHSLYFISKDMCNINLSFSISTWYGKDVTLWLGKFGGLSNLFRLSSDTKFKVFSYDPKHPKHGVGYIDAFGNVYVTLYDDYRRRWHLDMTFINTYYT